MVLAPTVEKKRYGGTWTAIQIPDHGIAAADAAHSLRSEAVHTSAYLEAWSIRCWQAEAGPGC